MQQNNRLIELREALPDWGFGRTSYYARTNPDCPQYDEACPIGVQLSDAPNAKRYFTQVEVAEYQRVLLERAHARAADRAFAARKRGLSLTAARQQRRAARTGE